ncbi:hypothetical protein MMC30_004862 [Trapelia coarctata]|nr:hypothetical protein [Trapelia coarctata]
MAMQFVYERHLPKDSLRLLKLTSDGETFHGVLEEFKMDNLPYFAAISWCWTSRSELQQVSFTCNDQQFPVSSHLYALLSNLNPKGVPSSLTIWIDAICINQHHLEEKDVHIPRMSEVYGNSHSVIVWLGEAEDESASVMDPRTVAGLNERLTNFPSYTSSTDVVQFGLPATSDPIWQAIGRLCERSWFYRTWVVQEVALARTVNMLCGSQWLGWDSLVTLINGISRTGLSVLCQNPEGPASTRPNGFGVFLDLVFTRKMHLGGGCPIDYLLRVIRLKEVTKPIDKIYGLFCLLGEELRSAVTVDYAEYEAQYWKVYMEVVRYIITTNEQSFWLLSMASSAERPEGLPTWVPNLNSTIPEVLDFSHQKWHAGILRESPQKIGISIIPDSPNIKVSGFVIAEVQEVVELGSPTPASDQQGGLSPGALRNRFLDMNARCWTLSQNAYSDASEALGAHARALVVDTWADGSPVLPSQQEAVSEAYLDAIAHLSRGDEAEAGDTTLEHRRTVMHQYLRQLGWWGKRPFFATKNGRIGRGAAAMRAGDAVCVFYSAGPVFVLRPKDDGSNELVGDAYVHGCMDLESLPPSDRGPDREFVIG